MNNFKGPKLKQALSHVLWIGGASDSGKTTIARSIAERRGLQVYHYDAHDAGQMERLAQALPRYQAFLDASLDERWVIPEPEDLFEFTLQAVNDRFPLAIEDLLAMPKDVPVVVEGYGFLPDLIAPILINARSAIWLTPTEVFKIASMVRRNKPSFKDKVLDPERAFRNLLRRDMLIAGLIRNQASSHGLHVIEIDGSRSVEEMVVLVERHFEPLLAKL